MNGQQGSTGEPGQQDGDQVPRPQALSPDLQLLASDLLGYNACDQLRGSFMGIGTPQDASNGESREPQPSTGTLWVEDCRAESLGQDVAVRIAGRGWTWIDEQQEQAGATFEIRQYLPFRAEVQLRGQPTAGYDAERHVVSLWLATTEPVESSLEPLRRPEVETPGLWGDILRGVVAVFTANPVEARAAEDVEERGGQRLRSQLEEGLTIAVDLCTGQRYQAQQLLPEGAIPPQPFEGVPKPWLANAMTLLHPKGLAIAGPWSEEGPVALRMEVLEGPGVIARVVCIEDARRAAQAYVEGGTTSLDSFVERRLGQDERAVETIESDCDLALVTTVPQEAPGPTTFRYLVSPEQRQGQALVDCGGDGAE